VPKPELHCTLEVREGVVWICLQGALRASGGAELTALIRARRGAKRLYPAVADLSGLEVADALGVEALRRELSRFAHASVVLPPPWVQACMLVRAHLAGFHLVERSKDLDTSSGAERRRHPRIVPRFPATIDLGGGRRLTAVTEDVSRGGARFSGVRNGRVLGAAELSTLVGQSIWITIAFLRMRSVRAQVVRVSGRPLGLGVAFQCLGPDPLRRIAAPEP
jgi:hypothetical protein